MHRYASPAWVETLDRVNKEGGQLMRLAAHLCGARCQEVIEGDFAFAKQLTDMGFGRAQVNATAQNAVVVDAGDSKRYADNLMRGFEEVFPNPKPNPNRDLLPSYLPAPHRLT